ncbi:hypothetical protein FRX94_12410 [Corynebacterium canis]|uniref:Uncharacterized protein n=3 Tax=Corynebacterium canis TaxID=679663 RepID=A0A5C5TVQ4_9CORY|nr:hypothetical protein [Corynebacterium canis]TWT17518.1 hypothetical protein FRX94_12410 [Corynebacterium canis]
MRLVASKAMRQTVTKDMRQVVTKVMKQVVTKVLRDDSPKTLQIVFLFFVEVSNEENPDDRRSTAAHNLSGQAIGKQGPAEPPRR